MSIQQGPSFVANESIGAYLVVAVPATSTSNAIRCELADTSTSMPIGVIQDNVSTDGSANVVTMGVARAMAGASVSAGSLLTWDTAGKVIETAATSATITTRAIGLALQNGSSGQIILINVIPQLIPNI